MPNIAKFLLKTMAPTSMNVAGFPKKLMIYGAVGVGDFGRGHILGVCAIAPARGLDCLAAARKASGSQEQVRGLDALMFEQSAPIPICS